MPRRGGKKGKGGNQQQHFKNQKPRNASSELAVPGTKTQKKQNTQVPQPKIYMSKLPYSVPLAEVSDLCCPYGNVVDCTLMSTKSAIITMNSIAECQEAIFALNDTCFPGTNCILKVEFAAGSVDVAQQEQRNPLPESAAPRTKTQKHRDSQKRKKQELEQRNAVPESAAPRTKTQKHRDSQKRKKQELEVKKATECKRLYVGRLDLNTTMQTLKDYCERWGDIELVEVSCRPSAKGLQGTGFVTYKDPVRFLDISGAGPYFIDDHEVILNKATDEKYKIPAATVLIKELPSQFTMKNIEDLCKPRVSHQKFPIYMYQFSKSTSGEFVNSVLVTMDTEEACKRIINDYNGKHAPGTSEVITIEYKPEGSVQTETTPQRQEAGNNQEPTDSWQDRKHVKRKRQEGGNNQKPTDSWQDRKHVKRKGEEAGNNQGATDRRQRRKRNNHEKKHSVLVSGIPLGFTLQEFMDALRPHIDEFDAELLEPGHGCNTISGFVHLLSHEARERFIYRYNLQIIAGTDNRMTVRLVTPEEEIEIDSLVIPELLDASSHAVSREESEGITCSITIRDLPGFYSADNVQRLIRDLGVSPDNIIGLALQKTGNNILNAEVKLRSWCDCCKVIKQLHGRTLGGCQRAVVVDSIKIESDPSKPKEYLVYITGIPHGYDKQKFKSALEAEEHIIHINWLPSKPSMPTRSALVKLDTFDARDRLIENYDDTRLPGCSSRLSIQLRLGHHEEKIVYIYGLPMNYGEQQLAKVCEKYGEVAMVTIMPVLAGFPGHYARAIMQSAKGCENLFGHLKYLPGTSSTVQVSYKNLAISEKTEEQDTQNLSTLEEVNIDQNTLQITGVPASLQTPADVRDICARHGLAKKGFIVRDVTSGQNIAYVKMFADIDSRTAIQKLDGAVLPGCTIPLSVKMAELPSLTKLDLSKPTPHLKQSDDALPKSGGEPAHSLARMNILPPEPSASAPGASLLSKKGQLAKLLERFKMVENLKKLKDQQGQLHQQMQSLQTASPIRPINPTNQETLEKELQRKEKEIQLTMKLKLLQEAKATKEKLKSQLEQQKLGQQSGGQQSESLQLLEEARKSKELLQQKEKELRKQTEEQKHLHLNKKLQMLQEAKFKQEMERKRIEAQANVEHQRVEQEEQELQKKLILLEEQNKKLFLETQLVGKESSGAPYIGGSRKRKPTLDDASNQKGNASGTPMEESSQLDPKLIKLDKSDGDGQVDNALAKGIFQGVTDSSSGMLGQAIIDKLTTSGIQNKEMLPEVLKYIGALPRECLHLLAELPVDMLDNFCKVNPMQLYNMAASLPELNSLIQNINLDQLIHYIRAIGAEGFHTLTSQMSKDPQVFLHIKTIVPQNKNVPSVSS